MSAPDLETLPDGWRWDAERGPWACHAIGPNGRAATVHTDGSLGTARKVPREVVAACYHRADRLFGQPEPTPPGGSEPTITAKQLAMMMHCAGGKLRGHRNYYVAADGPDHGAWQALVGSGLAEHEDGKPQVFRLTSAGFVFLFGIDRAALEPATPPGGQGGPVLSIDPENDDFHAHHERGQGGEGGAA